MPSMFAGANGPHRTTKNSALFTGFRRGTTLTGIPMFSIFLAAFSAPTCRGKRFTQTYLPPPLWGSAPSGMSSVEDGWGVPSADAFELPVSLVGAWGLGATNGVGLMVLGFEGDGGKAGAGFPRLRFHTIGN